MSIGTSGGSFSGVSVAGGEWSRLSEGGRFTFGGALGRFCKTLVGDGVFKVGANYCQMTYGQG